MMLHSLKETVNMEGLISTHSCPNNPPFPYWMNPTWSRKSQAFSVGVVWALMQH